LIGFLGAGRDGKNFGRRETLALKSFVIARASVELPDQSKAA
jgi:hypothetical protein